MEQERKDDFLRSLSECWHMSSRRESDFRVVVLFINSTLRILMAGSYSKIALIAFYLWNIKFRSASFKFRTPWILELVFIDQPDADRRCTHFLIIIGLFTIRKFHKLSFRPKMFTVSRIAIRFHQCFFPPRHLIPSHHQAFSLQSSLLPAGKLWDRKWYYNRNTWL